MTNKVQYQRQEDGNAICFVDEGDGWVHYTKSKLNAPGLNKGLDNSGLYIFRLALKENYEVLKIKSDY